jgi:anti-sigma factor RsiW
MNNLPASPTENELHAYVDGALDASRRAEIEIYLASHPDVADQVARWRRDADFLRTEFAGAMKRPIQPRLDPAAVRRRLRVRSRVRMSAAAALFVAVGVGGVSGWNIRTMSLAPAPMADATDAYRVFAFDRSRPVEMGAENVDHLQRWMSTRLGTPISLPDLRSEGFDLLGGRLLATTDGPAALIFYQDRDGERVSIYVRPSDRFPEGTHGARNEGGLMTRYWYKKGYGYAMVAKSGDPRIVGLESAVRMGG